MIRCVHILLAAGLVAAGAAGLDAAEAPNAKLLGTWTHHCGDYRVKLEIKPDRLHCTIAGPDGVAFTADADYVMSKDGVVLGIIRAKGAVKADGEDGLKDRLFYFRVTARDRALKVSDLNYGGDDDGQTADVLEGTYVRHDGKHTGAVSRSDKRPHSKTESKASSEDPNRRISELLNDSEDLRQIGDQWERIWFTDQPSHLTPYRGSVLGRISDDWQAIWKFFTRPSDSEAVEFDSANWVGP